MPHSRSATSGRCWTDGWFECLGAPQLRRSCAARGRWSGHHGLARLFNAIGDTAEMQAFAPAEVSLRADGRVVAEGTEAMRSRAGGRETRTRWLHLFVLRDGLIPSATEWNEGAVLSATFRGD